MPAQSTASVGSAKTIYGVPFSFFVVGDCVPSQTCPLKKLVDDRNEEIVEHKPFLVLADLFSRVALAPNELPVGVVTALIGGPFFLYLLRRRGRTHGFV